MPNAHDGDEIDIEHMNDRVGMDLGDFDVRAQLGGLALRRLKGLGGRRDVEPPTRR